MARWRIGADDPGRQSEHGRAVDQARVVKLGLELTQHRGKRRADRVERRQLMRADSRQADLLKRARERARKSGTVGDRREIAQRASGRELVDSARRHRFDAEPGGRRQAVAKQTLGAQHAEQPGRGHSMHAE
ncbi:MAG: hypothetical protein ACREF1_11475 [Acetobacteraceae bacterium]